MKQHTVFGGRTPSEDELAKRIMKALEEQILACEPAPSGLNMAWLHMLGCSAEELDELAVYAQGRARLLRGATFESELERARAERVRATHEEPEA